MDTENKTTDSSRRQFLGQVLQLGCLACLTPAKLCSAAQLKQADLTKDESKKHKFLEDSKFTFEQVYGLAFQQQLIPNLKYIADQIGQDKLIDIIKKGSEERSFQWGKYTSSKLVKPGLNEFIDWHRKPNWFWEHVVTYSVVEDTPQAFEAKFTECIWAKTFLDAKCGDLGYAAICHGDFAYASGFSDKLKLVRTKTLMQGDDHCNHRYIWSE